MGTITAANSIFMLSVDGVFSTPQLIQGYAADDAFDVDAVSRAQVVIGVDGRKSQGYTPVIKTLNLHLQADSPSMELFELWASLEDEIQETFEASGSIALPSVGRTYDLTNGTLMGFQYFSPVKKVLQPRSFAIAFEAITGAPL